MRPNEEHFWRTSHVLLVFFIYIALLLIFFVIEKLLFGGEVVDVDYKNPGTFLFEELVIAGVMIVLPLLVVRYTYHASLEEIGISSNRIAEYFIIGIIAGIFIWIATSVVDFGVEKIIEEGDVNPYIRSLRLADSYLSYSVILGSIVLLGPISEEVYFRGFAYSVFKKRYGKSAAVVLSSVLFSAIHLDPRMLIQITVIGIGLAITREKFGSIIPAISAHSTINLLGIYVGGAT